MALALVSDDQLHREIKEQFVKYMNSIGLNEVDSEVGKIFDYLVDDAVMDIIFECDIERKTGLQDIIQGGRDEEKYEIIDKDGVDVFGEAPGKKNYECECPCCKRPLAASRFAPHLEKCMGMGRNSSRLASRRIATNLSSDLSMFDDEDDMDWVFSSDKKAKKKSKKALPKVTSSNKTV